MADVHARADDILIRSNPPICEDEWGDDGDEVHEATILPFPPPPGGKKPTKDPRQTTGAAAGREIRRQRTRDERKAVALLLKRLQALREKLETVILKGSTFRASQATLTIRAIDAEIADATADLAALARREIGVAAELGTAHVDQTILGAKFRPLVTPGVTGELVTTAAELTADLLSEPMRAYRRRIVQQVRRLTVQGSDFGTEWTQLAKVLDAQGIANAEFSAERILRTEMSRVFNQATHDRLTQQAATMPFLRKTWIRVLDGRTREEHKTAGERYARGKGIEIPTRFEVGKATMRFPVDPLTEPGGQIAASMTIMCRCVSGVEFEAAGVRQATAQRIALAMGR